MKRYNAISGLKGIAILLIIFLHTFVNGKFAQEGSGAYNAVEQLAVLIRLFFILSSFGMCCGYYEKFKNKTIDLNNFYSRRYKKILPFFAIIVFAEVLVSGISEKILKEAFLDLTLIFGFLPKGNIEVVGIGWTLGVIFSFYILFPFFVFLLWNKKRAWVILFLTLIINMFCGDFFVNGESVVMVNIVLWSIYFIIGGMIYLYKDWIVENLKKQRLLLLVGTVLFIGGYIANYLKWNNKFLDLLFIAMAFILITMYAISGKSFLLENKAIQIVGKYCLEIYLSHMMIFRVVEKLHIPSIIHNKIMAFIIDYIIVCSVTLLFSIIAEKTITKVKEIFQTKIMKQLK